MAFAQLTYRESLRDIEVNLRAQTRRLCHMGFRCQTISRNTLANANATRPWQIGPSVRAHDCSPAGWSLHARHQAHQPGLPPHYPASLSPA